jgi:hypothetical protein
MNRRWFGSVFFWENIKLPKKHTEIGETKTPRHTPNLYSLGLNFRLFPGLFYRL